MTPPPHAQPPRPRPSPTVAGWLKADEYPEWDHFVARHPKGVLFHLSSWKQVIEASFPHMRGQVAVVRAADRGDILAGIPVYDVRSWLLGNRLVSIPFASLCDPLVQDRAHWDQLMPLIDAHRTAQGGVPFECRTWQQPEAPPVRDAACPYETSLHHWLDLSSGLDAAYSSFSRTAIRRMISRSVKSGTVVRHATTEADVEEFYRLLIISRRRNGLPILPYPFFLSIWRILPAAQRSFILASRDGRTVAAIFSLGFGRTFTMEHSGEEDAIYGSGIVQHLVWESIRTAYAQGCTCVSFGRTAVENTSLASYKLHWGTVQETLLTYWPGSPPIQRQAVATTSPTRRVIRWLSSYSPGPIYRAMSAFCYKHWG